VGVSTTGFDAFKLICNDIVNREIEAIKSTGKEVTEPILANRVEQSLIEFLKIPKVIASGIVTSMEILLGPTMLSDAIRAEDLLKQQGEKWYLSKALPEAYKTNNSNIINTLQKNFNTDLNKAINEFITKNNINPYLTIDDTFTYTFKAGKDGHWEIEIFKQ